MKKLNITYKGTAPLLMHADTGANPLHALTIKHKVLTAKRTKTHDDHEAIAKSEWLLGLYLKGDTIILPTMMLRKGIIEGARLAKNGKQIERGLIFTESEGFPLKFDGDKLSLDGLYSRGENADTRSVRVSQAKLMRTRPRFDNWSVTFDVLLDDGQMDVPTLIETVDNAGLYIGIGDFRPLFGRFEATVKVVS